MEENTNPQPRGVMLYTNFYDALKDLPDETVGKLLLALMRYTIFGEVPDFDPLTMTAWSFLRNYADNDRKRYAETVERRRAAVEKRWQREKAASPEKKTPQKHLHPKGIATPTASAHEGAEWMLKYMNPPKNAESPAVF